MCGEGGEYETTLVLDCPLYKKRLVLTEVEVTETVDGVGMLGGEEKEDLTTRMVRDDCTTVASGCFVVSLVKLLLPFLF